MDWGDSEEGRYVGRSRRDAGAGGGSGVLFVSSLFPVEGNDMQVTASLVKCLTTALGAGGPDGKW